MEPPAKKQKTNETYPPIVFKLPGYENDTCLTVFHQDFHVHSMMLKIHSAFFRKFMDSPDKIPRKASVSEKKNSDTTRAIIDDASNIESALTTPLASSTNPVSRFKYNWVTEVDDDAPSDGVQWYLIWTNPKTFTKEPYTESDGPANSEEIHQVRSFRKLLLAVYGRTYILSSLYDLRTMTTLADYYCMLPVLSRSLDRALLKSPGWAENLRWQSIRCFELAAKLRNEMLFREALIWVTGPHSNPSYLKIADRSLRNIAKCAHADVLMKVSELAQMITRKLGREIDFHKIEQESDKQCFQDLELCGDADEDIDDDLPSAADVVLYPWYFRRIAESSLPYIDDEWRLEEMLTNKLVLQKELKAGDLNKHLDDYFLCAEIDDEDLPWDPEEVDW